MTAGMDSTTVWRHPPGATCSHAALALSAQEPAPDRLREKALGRASGRSPAAIVVGDAIAPQHAVAGKFASVCRHFHMDFGSPFRPREVAGLGAYNPHISINTTIAGGHHSALPTTAYGDRSARGVESDYCPPHLLLCDR